MGPSGTGALWGSIENLESLKPFLLGGETVTNSSLSGFDLEGVPARFEAGLQDYAGIIGFGAAADYLKRIGMERVSEHESLLNKELTSGLGDYERVMILGPDDPADRGSIVSFTVKGVRPHEIAGLLSSSANVCVRSGMHCVHSWFNEHRIEGSVRASFGVYNSSEEVGAFLRAFKSVMSIV